MTARATGPGKTETGPGQALILMLAALICLVIGGPAHANDIALVDLSDTKSAPVDRHLVHHIDRKGELSADAIAAAPHRLEWSRTGDAVPNFGLLREPVWFAVKLRNTTPEELRRLLVIPYPPLDSVQVHLFRDGEPSQTFEVGDSQPFTERPLQHRHYVVPLDLVPEAEYTLLMRVQTSGAMQVPATLWEPNAFTEQTQHEFALQLLFTGIMLALAAYNLLLFFVVRDRAYLWYVLYLVAFMLALLAIRGIGFQYLWPGQPWINDLAIPLFLSVSLMAVGFFTHNFLNLGAHSRLWSYFILGVAWMGVAFMVLSLILPYATMLTLMMPTVGLAAPVFFIAGCHLWWKGEILARFYVISWSVFLFGNVLFNASKGGLLPHNAAFEYATQIGVVIQMLLLSFALAYRINLERRRRQQAQAEALEMQRQANEQLESRVEERTNELQQAYNQLKEMSELDGLTQLKNRPYFDQALEREWRRNTRECRTVSLLMLDVDHFKWVNDNMGHPCGDACLRHLAEICRKYVGRAADVVARYGGEEFVMLLPCTTLGGATLVAERIRRAVETHDFRWEGRHIPLTLSLGVAGRIPDLKRSYESLVRQADEALYRAKNEGRNRVMVSLEEEHGITIAAAEEILPSEL